MKITKLFILFVFLLLPILSYSIVDGEIISSHQFRQSVALTFKKDNFDSKGEIYCSGTLIGPRVVITAAHCFTSGAKSMKVSLEEFKKKTWIFLGETNTEDDLPMVEAQFQSANVILHPINDSIYSDVALIELKEDINLEKWQIKAIALSLPSKAIIGKELIHVGYGQITNNGLKGVKALMQLPIKEFNGYNGIGVGERFSKGPSACHGDSGGSAYLVMNSSEYRFVGVEYSVSNHPCGESATYFVPLTQKIIDWAVSLGRPLFL